jgi:rare lipoprotein A
MKFFTKLTTILTLSTICALPFTTANAQSLPKESNWQHASWYGPGFHGRLAADGKPFNMHRLTAAHKTLPFGTKLKVTCQTSGKSVVVTVTDRGPFVKGRALDLSYGAAKALGMIDRGVGKVKYQVLN